MSKLHISTTEVYRAIVELNSAETKATRARIVDTIIQNRVSASYSAYERERLINQLKYQLSTLQDRGRARHVVGSWKLTALGQGHYREGVSK